LNRWGYAKQIEIVVTAQRFVCGFGLAKMCGEEKSTEALTVGEADNTQIGIECPRRVA
jgi:hypothetical protein